MSKLFLDTNFYIDLVLKRRPIDTESLFQNDLFLSPLSVHILVYSYKYKIPNTDLTKNSDFFDFIDFNSKILNLALTGPTNDLEDNIQLQSAIEAEADYFLTSDQNLLQMGIFGRTRIVSSISHKP